MKFKSRLPRPHHHATQLAGAIELLLPAAKDLRDDLWKRLCVRREAQEIEDETTEKLAAEHSEACIAYGNLVDAAQRLRWVAKP